jgi:DNA primase large subunit
MKKLVISLSLVAAFFNLPANATEYQIYDCQNRNDMNNCSGSCKKSYKLDLKVNTDKQLVMASDIQRSHALDNCKVVDMNNWTCKTESKIELQIIGNKIFGGSDYEVTQRMFNGNLTIYEYSSFYKEKHEFQQKFKCGKKSGWFD